MKAILLMACTVWTLTSFATPVSADERKFDLVFSILSDQGYVATSRDLMSPPADFQLRFQPQGGSMTLDKKSASYVGDYGLGVEPVYRFSSGWELGVPIQYNTFGGLGENLLGHTVYNWWDPVTVVEIRLRKVTPSVGLSLRKGHWRGQYSMQRYEIETVDFRGIDRPGAQNTSEEIGLRKSRGINHRVDLMYYFEQPDERVEYAIGAMSEFVSNNYWFVGIGFRGSFMLLGRR
jgi:hypothetical protein